uniref:Uncharacterized protein n=1 Tax=Sphaerodactylus townsendi TaxID=933632 RepID=A0ACB8EGL9_9SAUR
MCGQLMEDTDRTVCHNCRQGLSPRQFHSDKAAENDVLAIEVACPNFDCTWSGTLKSYQEHVCPSAAQCGSAKESTFVLRDQLRGQLFLEHRSCPIACGVPGADGGFSEAAAEQPGGHREVSPALLFPLLRNATCGKKRSAYSPVFATHAFGYRLCVRMYPDGDGIGKGSHLSLFLALAQGPYDDVLPWPFQQKVTFFLLDPTQKKSPLKETFLPDPHSTSFHQPHERLNVASGSPLFATKAQIPGYLKDDVLYLKVVVDLAGMNV